MAITRTQIAKQLLAQGGRTGFQGGGADAGTRSFAESQGRSKAEVDQLGRDFGFSGRDVAGDSGRQVSEARAEQNRQAAIEREKFERAQKRKKVLAQNKNFLENMRDKLRAGYVRRTKASNLKDLGVFGKVSKLPGIAGGFIDAVTVPDETDLFDIDSIREIGSQTQYTKSIDPVTGKETFGTTARQADILSDLREDIQMENALKEGNVSFDDFQTYLNRNKIENIGGDGPQDPCRGPNPPAYCFTGIRSAEPEVEEPEYVNPLSKLTPRIAGTQFAAAGGGIASLDDMDREGFLLGGIAKGLKKAVRGIKKLAKSPIGKAALGFAALQYGGGFGGLKTKLFGTPGYYNIGSALHGSGVGKAIASNPGLLGKLGLTAGGGSMALTGKGVAAAIGIPSILAGAMTPKEDKDKFDIDSYYAANQLNPSQSIRGMGSEFDFYGGERMRVAEGGSTEEKEPVAKKTMPLLDMDGMEKDYREEGGFVPIGRMEKADDVPARLSKNEFVFTADAVRNAGDGNVDKGAEVMYNMMKNLESGGEVSEESQGKCFKHHRD